MSKRGVKYIGRMPTDINARMSWADDTVEVGNREGWCYSTAECEDGYACGLPLTRRTITTWEQKVGSFNWENKTVEDMLHCSAAICVETFKAKWRDALESAPAISAAPFRSRNLRFRTEALSGEKPNEEKPPAVNPGKRNQLMLSFEKYVAEGNVWQANNTRRKLKAFVSKEEAEELKERTDKMEEGSGASDRDGVRETFHPSGQVANSGNYVGGFKDGVETTYSAEGQKISSVEHRRGIIHGLSESWYPDGVLQSRGSIVDGKRQGTWIYQRPDGTPHLVWSGYYKDDVKVSDDPD